MWSLLCPCAPAPHRPQRRRLSPDHRHGLRLLPHGVASRGCGGGAHHRPAVHRVPPVARDGASGGRGELAGAGAGPRLRARPAHPEPPGHGLGVGSAPPLPRLHPAVPPLHPQPGARHRHAHHLILLY